MTVYFVLYNMYDKSTNFLKISSIFGEYFLQAYR